MGVPDIPITIVDAPNVVAADVSVADRHKLELLICDMLFQTVVNQETDDNAAAMATLIRETEYIAVALAANYDDLPEVLLQYLNKPYTWKLICQFNDWWRGKPTIEHIALLAGSMGRKVITFTIKPLEYHGTGADGEMVVSFPISYKIADGMN